MARTKICGVGQHLQRSLPENNGGSWIDDTATVLSNTAGLHSYGGVPYYGVNASGAYTADGVQREILMEVKGSDGNLGGSDANKEDALSYAANRNMSVGPSETIRVRCLLQKFRTSRMIWTMAIM